MLIPYASYFVSYLLDHLKNKNTIERIVLYGSVAREESTKESDVDIFIESKKNLNVVFQRFDLVGLSRHLRCLRTNIE